MPLKFLSELNLKQNPQSPLPSDEKGPNDQANLFDPESTAVARIEKLKATIARVLIALSLLPPLFLLIVLSYRFALSRQIIQTEKKKAAVIAELKEQDLIYKDAFLVLKKAEIIKETQGAENRFTSVIDSTFKPMTAVTEVEFSDLSAVEAQIRVKNSSALNVAGLILNYLEEGKVKEVSINSAEFVPDDNAYLVGLILTFNE